MPRIKFGDCDLCKREQPLTFHHLIPRTNHSNKWFKKRFTKSEMKTRGLNICRQCHIQIHKLFSEKELGRALNTLEALMEREEIVKYVKWVERR